MQISNAEKILMDQLWSNSPISAKQIIESIAVNNHDLDWHEKTVKTLLNRLLKKEAIGFEKKGREYFYYPILEQDAYIEIAADNFLKRVFNGSVTSMVSAFAKKEKLSSEDIAELKQLLNDIEKNGGQHD